ncbi:Uncharacterised protein [Moraxella ovis]|uniref:Uncharacterized protein n=1 Tax=Moraxella ovis TaxID=29433 RepID=A0A378PK77_9GAMM|nr:Uncharacterised protein [Moraxella ovis]
MFKKQMKDNAFDKLKQLLRNSTHLIISIMTAALVYVLISDVRFLRRFIPSIQWETIYLLTWDAFLINANDSDPCSSGECNTQRS